MHGKKLHVYVFTVCYYFTPTLDPLYSVRSLNSVNIY